MIPSWGKERRRVQKDSNRRKKELIKPVFAELFVRETGKCRNYLVVTV